MSATDVDDITAAAEEDPLANPGLFLRFANWVSEAMGRPANISFWFVAVMAWTLMFVLSKQLDKGTFLPSWFTSQGYNFPLNLVTTVAELFIGFLVAAAANRSQAALTILLDHIRSGVERDVTMEKNLTTLLAENTDITTAVHQLVEAMKDETDRLDEIHRHVTAISEKLGIDVNASDPPPAAAAPD
jgi:low affinity Fe/Cu permease